MKKRKIEFSSVLLLVGAFLVFAAVALLAFSNINSRNALKNAAKTILELREVMPSVKDEVKDDRVNITMPVMQVGGIDYCGIIELPQYETELPIYAYWDKNKVSKQPCVYTGSIYDSSLVIGGSDNKGQFDFMQTVTDGDMVYITDMTGARYTYEVKKIKRAKEVKTEKLLSDEYDLTLFAKNTYSLDYTIVYCEFK